MMMRLHPIFWFSAPALALKALYIESSWLYYDIGNIIFISRMSNGALKTLCILPKFTHTVNRFSLNLLLSGASYMEGDWYMFR